MTRPASVILLAALAASSSVEGFAPAGFPARSAAWLPRSSLAMAEDEEKQPSIGGGGAGGSAKQNTFDESVKGIEDEEAALALERTAGMDAQEEEAYKARSTEFSSMKDKIRARAEEQGIEKSVATAEAIKAAEKRARLQQSSDDSNGLDMSVFTDPEKNPIMYNPEDELTEEEITRIDPIGQKPFLEQAQYEFAATTFPGPVDIAKTVGFMFLTFVVSATFILKSDEFLRHLYEAQGFIPGPNSNFEDYADLELPGGWDDDLDGLTGSLAKIVETAKQATPK